MKKANIENAEEPASDEKPKSETVKDIVEETSLESFPASDAPAWNTGHAHPPASGDRRT